MTNVSIRNTNSADLIRQLHQKPTVLNLQCIEILFGAARLNIQPFTLTLQSLINNLPASCISDYRKALKMRSKKS